MYFLGLDTYEEGEMYINGKETSDYTELDFEAYRKKYIGNIFQNFNLINSYTVYQNVELVLLINGYKKRKVKKQILEVLDKVGLLKYKNTKVSKLSGGQKQRVAIARALIKETPIIVADEPTGNLDSKTAENIMELLYEVSKDKLVIVVTHNYEQVEKYVTRKLVMHDGKIIEDKKIKREIIDQEMKEENGDANDKLSEIPNTTENSQENKSTNTKLDNKEKTKITKLSDIPKSQNKKKNIGPLNKLRLGIRNTFNIKIKFVLLLAVFLFLATAVFAEYAAYKKQTYDQSNLGYNNYFRETSDKRIVIKKNDASQITAEDYENIKNIPNVDYIVENDLLLDTGISVNTEGFGMYGYAKSIDLFDMELAYGEMPQNDNEVIVCGEDYDYYLAYMPDKVIGLECTVRANGMSYVTDSKIKIVGIAYKPSSDYGVYTNFYMNNNLLDEIRKNINIEYSTTTTEFNGKILPAQQYSMMYKVLPNPNVPEGKAYVPEDFNYMTKYNNARNYTLNITFENMYFTDSMEVKVANIYTKKNFKNLTGITEGEDPFGMYNGAIFVNSNEYQEIFNRNSYQSSVFIKDEKGKDAVLQALQDSGYKTLYVKDCLQSYTGGYDVISNVITICFLGGVAVALFFISYFIIKIILKSRNVYFSTIRILGATRKNAKSLLRIELFTIMNIAYAGVLTVIALIKNKAIENEYLQSMITYLELKDFILVYLLLFIISMLISNRYSKKLFKKSAMNTYRDEEV